MVLRLVDVEDDNGFMLWHLRAFMSFHQRSDILSPGQTRQHTCWSQGSYMIWPQWPRTSRPLSLVFLIASYGSVQAAQCRCLRLIDSVSIPLVVRPQS